MSYKEREPQSPRTKVSSDAIDVSATVGRKDKSRSPERNLLLAVRRASLESAALAGTESYGRHVRGLVDKTLYGKGSDAEDEARDYIKQLRESGMSDLSGFQVNEMPWVGLGLMEFSMQPCVAGFPVGMPRGAMNQREPQRIGVSTGLGYPEGGTRPQVLVGIRAGGAGESYSSMTPYGLNVAGYQSEDDLVRGTRLPETPRVVLSVDAGHYAGLVVPVRNMDLFKATATQNGIPYRELGDRFVPTASSVYRRKFLGQPEGPYDMAPRC